MNIKQFLEDNQDELLNYYDDISSIAKAVRKLCNNKGVEYTESFRAAASKIINSCKDTENFIETDTNQYNEVPSDMPSAWDRDKNKYLSIEEFCDKYGLDKTSVKSSKLVSHNASHMTYNIAFYEDNSPSHMSIEEVKPILSKLLLDLKKPYKVVNTNALNRVGVVKIADLHVGALIEGLIRTKDYNVDILREKLLRAADEINNRCYKTVHVHLIGDLIETFTGLSHINSWKSVDKNIVGANAVKVAVQILTESFLEKINNLGEVKIIAGNHDRVTSNNKEDVEGDAANLIAWALDLLGYSVEFNPVVITHVVDGIAHILTHGHHGISKKSTKQLCWDYGVKGKYNLICEGHLHSIIQKLTSAKRENFTTIQDDAVDHRRFNCPSFFTGNYYSETLGYTSESGFVITEDNGNGVPNVFYYAV